MERPLWLACGSRMHDQLHSNYQTKKHHTRKHTPPSLHWPHTRLCRCMYTSRTRQQPVLSGADGADAHDWKLLTKSGNSRSACQWMLDGCMPLSDVRQCQQRLPLSAVRCFMQNVIGLCTELLDMLLSACTSTSTCDPSSSLCEWMLTATCCLSARTSSCRHAPELRHALFLAFILLLEPLHTHPSCGSLPLLPVHSHKVYVAQLIEPLTHTRSAKLAWAPHKSGMQHGETHFSCSEGTLMIKVHARSSRTMRTTKTLG